MAEAQNLIKPYERDFGTAIQALIQDNIKNINTAFIAKVESISEDKKKVNISNVITPFSDAGTQSVSKNIVIPNVLIAQPYSSEWQIQFKVGVGDYGLAIVCKDDITKYKDSGGVGEANTARKFDVIDSVFIPLSLFLQSDNENAGFSIKNKSGDCELTFDKNGKLNIVSKGDINIESKGALSIKSANPMSIGTNDTLLACFNAIIDGMQNAIIGGVTTGSPATQTITQLPAYTAQAQTMKATIQKVLK